RRHVQTRFEAPALRRLHVNLVVEAAVLAEVRLSGGSFGGGGNHDTRGPQAFALGAFRVDVPELSGVVPGKLPDFDEVLSRQVGGFFLRGDVIARLEPPALGRLDVDILVVPAAGPGNRLARRAAGRRLHDDRGAIRRPPFALVVAVP